MRFHHLAPEYDFEAVLLADPSGLLVEYRGIASRVQVR
jgi:hypothetical protein